MQSHPINQSISEKEPEETLIKLSLINENDKDNDEIDEK